MERIIVISDLHLLPDDQILSELSAKIKEFSPTRLVLLGDIFDVMVGNHKEYLQIYNNFFNWIDSMILNQCHVDFVEGNHDFHLKSLLTKRFSTAFHYHKESFILNGSSYFAHGDGLDMQDTLHLKYRSVIKSYAMGVFIRIIGLKGVQLLAQFLKSKSSGHYGNMEKVRERYRVIAKEISEKFRVNRVFLGHSHVNDYYIFNDCEYYNCGDGKKDRKFILVDQNQVSFISF